MTTGALNIVVVEFLPSGGMFQFSYLFADALAAAGHQVTLLTGPDPELRATRPGLTIRPILPTWHPNADEATGMRRKVRRAVRALQLADSWRRVIRYVRRHRPDVVQFGELRYALDSAALLALTRSLGRGTGSTAVVDVAHNPVPYDVTSAEASVQKTGRITRMLLDRAYQVCDLVLVLGDGPRQDLLREFPAVRRVVVCGHGDYSAVLASVQVPPPSAAPPSALLFGAWTKYKNIPLLLDAFELLRVDLPEATLTIAGPVMPDVDLPGITARAAGIGQVELRPGYVPMESLPELFGSHRLVMFPYETVNISGSVHMAYTFGRPVVATRVGGMSDVVVDGVTGVLCEPEAGAIAAAMARVLDADTAARMGVAAAAHSEAAASWSTVADKAVAGYRSALTLEPGSSASGHPTASRPAAWSTR